MRLPTHTWWVRQSINRSRSQLVEPSISEKESLSIKCHGSRLEDRQSLRRQSIIHSILFSFTPTSSRRRRRPCRCPHCLCRRFFFVSSHLFFAILQRQTLVNHSGRMLNRYTFSFFVSSLSLFLSFSSTSSPSTLVKKNIDICRSQPMIVDIHISFFSSLLSFLLLSSPLLFSDLSNDEQRRSDLW